MLRNSLTSKQVRKLRSLGMTEEAVVMIGKEGVTPAVVASAREAIKKRELIKVRVLQNAPDEPEDAITVLAERADANLVQVIGRNGLLFRRNFDKPRIELWVRGTVCAMQDALSSRLGQVRSRTRRAG